MIKIDVGVVNVSFGKCRKPRRGWIFSTKFPGGTMRSKSMTIRLQNDAQIPVGVEPDDELGLPAPDANALSATSSDDTIATAVMTSDGKSVVVVAQSDGAATITVTDGTISGEFDVEVVDPTAVAFKFTEGKAVPKGTPIP